MRPIPSIRIPRFPFIAACALLAAVACLPLLAGDPSPAAGPSGNAGGAKDAADEAAIREVVRKYVDAREAQDPKVIEPLFTADADQLVSDGTWRRGRDALVRGMLESSKRTGGRRTITVESVRMPAPGVALADGRYRQTGLTGGSSRDLWSTFVLTRDGQGGQGWKIAAIRNMLPAAPAPPAGR